jgi:predicted RNA polymerase sigma factor
LAIRSWHVIAVTERDGAEGGLIALGSIVGLERSHLWPAAMADNLRPLGRDHELARELETAAALAPTVGERRLLLIRLFNVKADTS